MNMKKTWVISVMLVVLAMICLIGCESVEAKELIVSNTSSGVSITGVQIQQTVGTRIIDFVNIMDEGETIAPGESKSFYIAPSTGSLGTELAIKYSSIEDSFTFTYDYTVNGKNQPVTVYFDGTDFAVSGSNAEELQES